MSDRWLPSESDLPLDARQRIEQACTRFEKALRAVRAGDAPALGLVAAQAGYADQAHLTREFRQFAGFPPGCLHRVPGPTPWHVVHDETFKTRRPEPGTLPP